MVCVGETLGYGRTEISMRRSLPSLALLIAVAASCVGPARTTSAYQDKAVETASTAVGAARTVLLAAQLGDQDRSFAPTIAVTVADAENDAASALAVFTSIQPPDAASDALRAELLPDLQRIVDDIGFVRIAARRAGDQLGDVAAPLEEPANRLDAFAERYG
jgi:hypothetical protein